MAPTPLGVCRGFLTSVCLLHRCVEVSGAQVRWVDVLKDSAITKGAGVADLRTLRMASCEEAIIASWEGGAVRAPFSRATPGVAGSWGVCGIPEPRAVPGRCQPVLTSEGNSLFCIAMRVGAEPSVVGASNLVCDCRLSKLQINCLTH